MTVGFDVFNYGRVIRFGASWVDYPVTKPTLYQHCLTDDEFPGWTLALDEGETHLDQITPNRNDDASAISVPEGWKVTLYKHGVNSDDNVIEELVGPINVDCLTGMDLNDEVTTVVVENTGSSDECSTNDDCETGEVCESGVCVDEEEDEEETDWDKWGVPAVIGGGIVLVLLLMPRGAGD